MSRIVLDVEATGKNPAQICQLAYLICGNGAIVGKNMFFSVDEVAEAAYRIHGMSTQELKELSGGETFQDRAEEIRADFEGAELIIGHNVSSDLRYLREEYARLGRTLAVGNTLCTMNRFTPVMKLRRLGNRAWKPPRLEEMAEFCGVTPEMIAGRAGEWFGGGGAAHDARYDAAAAYLCFLEGEKQGWMGQKG